MVTIFLSHSSLDKDYVRKVRSELLKSINRDQIIFDEDTFKIGNKSRKEIELNLRKTKLFVVFLSKNSLTSDWVKKELKLAKKYLKDGIIKCVLPIIIDKDIKYGDSIIPKWLEEYNLNNIGKYKIASSCIISKMIDISFNNDANRRNNIFVGRNELVGNFEKRFDDLNRITPKCVITSGLTSIGRRSFIKHCLKKIGIIDNDAEILEIFLTSTQSIEDFINELWELYGDDENDLIGLMNKGMDEKVKIAVKLSEKLIINNKKLIVIDNNCIIDYDGIISDWMFNIIENLNHKNSCNIFIVSNYRLKRKNYINNDSIFHIEVPELSIWERKSLLKRYIELTKIPIEDDIFQSIADVLSGYPEQVFYAVKLYQEVGKKELVNNMNLILEFSEQKAKILIKSIETDEQKIQFLRLLSEFTQIDLNTLFDIVGNEDIYKNMLQEFINNYICEYFGSNKEYIRVTDIVRDYIKRRQVGFINEKFEAKINENIKKFIESESKSEYINKELYYYLKRILSDKTIKPSQNKFENFIIPSMYLSIIKEKYEIEKDYNNVIAISENILDRRYSMDERIIDEVRFFRCLSLAKLKSGKVLEEVNEIKKPVEKHFIKGFYYRQVENNLLALQELKECLRVKPDHSRAKRELVQVYINSQEFSKALKLAKSNYEKYRDNPYHIQSYFMCIIKSDKNSENKKILGMLIEDLESSIKTDKTKEMLLLCKAQFEAIFNDNKDKAYELINEAIYEFKNSIYVYIQKFEICLKFNDVKGMESSYKILEEMNKNKRKLIWQKCVILAKQDKLDEAIDIINKEKNLYTEEAKERLIERLDKLTK